MSVGGERTSGGKHFCYVHLKCEINLVTDKMKTTKYHPFGTVP